LLQALLERERYDKFTGETNSLKSIIDELGVDKKIINFNETDDDFKPF
jgi:hypothetical protein